MSKTLAVSTVKDTVSTVAIPSNYVEFEAIFYILKRIHSTETIYTFDSNSNVFIGEYQDNLLQLLGRASNVDKFLW